MNKPLILLIFFLSILISVSPVKALDVTATNGSAAAIQDAVDQVAAAGGGNVYIPAGNFTFNIDFSVLRVNNGYAGVQVPSGVNVFGAGNNQTILYCPLSGWNYSDTAHGQSLFVLDGTGNKTTRISGIYFQGSMNMSDGADDDRNLVGISVINVRDFRIDNDVFIDFSNAAIYTGGIHAINPSGDRGVIDHVIIDNPYRDRFLPHNSSAPQPWALWGYGIICVGDYSTWDSNIANYLGQYRPLTVYIENSKFVRTRHAIASNGNAFYVSRYNYFEKCFYGANDVHGNAGNGIGGRGLESYSNIFNLSDESYSHGQDFAFQLRGGGGVVWNNTVILNPSYSNSAMMIINETVAPYDIEQLYVWNNTAVYSNGTSVSFDSKINNQGNFIANTNYFLRAPNQAQDGFTYTPYTYPHPLTLEPTPELIKNKIIGTLKDKNNQPLQGKIIAYQGANTINSTDFNGYYFLSVLSGTYDIQFNLTNFFIPNYAIKILNFNLTNDTYDIIESITGNQSDNKVSIILDVNSSQNIEVYSIIAPSNVKKNNTALINVSSLSNLANNTWFYQFPYLYVRVTSNVLSKLHVDGRFIKEESGNTVYLRGVNKGWESTTGWWHPIGGGIWDGIGVYNPDAVKANLDAMKSWGANAWRVHTNLEMWIKNPNIYKDQYRNVTYTKNYRDMLKEAITWAGERGIYVIFDFYNVESCFDVSAACSEAQDPLPFPPYQTDANPPGTPDQIIPNAQAFCDIWKNVSIEFKDFKNVVFELFNEPTGNDTAKNDWFNAVQDCTGKIRSVTDNIIMVQWSYGVWANLDFPPPSNPGDTLNWVDDPRLQGSNIIYDFHIYRGNFHRTVGGREDSWNRSELLLGYQYTLIPDAISKNKALIVGEIGANMWNTGDALTKELAFFSNNLDIFNQWNLSYTAWVWTVPAHMQHGLLQNGIWIPPPNEAGQILINKIAEGKS